jgi:hypothetical protein
MKKVTVQLKKLLLEEDINRRKENSYKPPRISPEFKSSILIQSVFKSVQVCLSVFECNSVCKTV